MVPITQTEFVELLKPNPLNAPVFVGTNDLKSRKAVVFIDVATTTPVCADNQTRVLIDRIKINLFAKEFIALQTLKNFVASQLPCRFTDAPTADGLYLQSTADISMIVSWGE